MTDYEKAALEMEALKDTPAEIEGLVQIDAKGPKNAGIVYSLRLTGDEFLRISAAAKARGTTLAAFLRSAALVAADEPSAPADAAKAVALQEVREKTRELAEAVQRL